MNTCQLGVDLMSSSKRIGLLRATGVVNGML